MLSRAPVVSVPKFISEIRKMEFQLWVFQSTYWVVELLREGLCEGHRILYITYYFDDLQIRSAGGSLNTFQHSIATSIVLISITNLTDRYGKKLKYCIMIYYCEEHGISAYINNYVITIQLSN